MIYDFGGQFIPISIDDDSIVWKNPQNIEKKNITSEMINIIIPSPQTTRFLVRCP